MRLENANTVDYLVVGRDGGYAAVLLDDFQGSDERLRLGLLQAKIVRYLDFIESGEAHSRLDEMLGRPVDRRARVGIQIIAMQPLGQLGERFLQHVTQAAQVESVLVSFEVRPLDPSGETSPPAM